MTRTDLAQMSQEAMIDLILAQAQQVANLQAEVEVLRMKLEKGKKPPTNSGNSSQPPSQDQKGNTSEKRKRHKHGPPQGHVKHDRPLVSQPDQIVEVKPKFCKECQTELGQVEAVLVDVNQVTELPEAKAEVIEVRQYSAGCPCCGKVETEEPPAGLEMERSFGARLEATVVYYRQEQHMSYVRTQAAMHNLHGVEISEGGIDKIMQRAGKRAIEDVKVIEAEVQQSAVIHCDETSSRVAGNNYWQWVFCSVTAVLHVIRFDRSFDVIKEIMGTRKAEVWVSDCYGAQMMASSKWHQLCLAHQLRNLMAVIELYPTNFWARHVHLLFQYAIHLHNQRQKIPEIVFSNRIERIERLFDQLLNQTLDQPEERRLQKRYRKYRQALFVFLYRTDASPTNNLSERHLRPSVIHRKVTGCFRSDWGAKSYAALKSVIDTGALSGINSFDVIQKLFGTPALPLRM
jgi:transposase